MISNLKPSFSSNSLYAKLTPRNIRPDKEALYAELLHTRQLMNLLSEQNHRLKTRVLQLEADLQAKPVSNSATSCALLRLKLSQTTSQLKQAKLLNTYLSKREKMIRSEEQAVQIVAQYAELGRLRDTLLSFQAQLKDSHRLKSKLQQYLLTIKQLKAQNKKILLSNFQLKQKLKQEQAGHRETEAKYEQTVKQKRRQAFLRQFAKRTKENAGIRKQQESRAGSRLFERNKRQVPRPHYTSHQPRNKYISRQLQGVSLQDSCIRKGRIDQQEQLPEQLRKTGVLVALRMASANYNSESVVESLREQSPTIIKQQNMATLLENEPFFLDQGHAQAILLHLFKRIDPTLSLDFHLFELRYRQLFPNFPLPAEGAEEECYRLTLQTLQSQAADALQQRTYPLTELESVLLGMGMEPAGAYFVMGEAALESKDVECLDIWKGLARLNVREYEDDFD